MSRGCAQSTDTSNHSATSLGVRTFGTGLMFVVRIPARDYSSGSSVQFLTSSLRGTPPRKRRKRRPRPIDAPYALTSCLFVRHLGCLLQKSVGRLKDAGDDSNRKPRHVIERSRAPGNDNGDCS